MEKTISMDEFLLRTGLPDPKAHDFFEADNLWVFVTQNLQDARGNEAL